MGKNSDTYGIFNAYRNMINEDVNSTEGDGLFKTKEEIESAKKRLPTILNEPMRKRMEKQILDSEKALVDFDGSKLPSKEGTPDEIPLSSPETNPSATNDTALNNILKPLPNSGNQASVPAQQSYAPRTKEIIQNELNAAIKSGDQNKANELFSELLPYSQKQKGEEGYKDYGADKLNLKASPFNPSMQSVQQMKNADANEPFKMQEPTKQGGGTTQPASQAAEQAPQKKTQSSGSVVDYLAGSGQESDFASRAKLAAQYGIQNYKGTAEQNTQLLNKLKSGEAPSAQGPEQQKTADVEPQPQSGGISKAIGGAGNVVKKGLIGSDQPLGGALGAVSKGLGSVGNVPKNIGNAAKGAVGGASKAIGGAGNLVKKGLIGSDQPLGGALGAVSKGLGSVGNIPKNIGNVAKGAVGGASKAIGGAGNLAKQGLTGQKEPMGGILGGISKGIGSIGNVAKRAVGGGSFSPAQQPATQVASKPKYAKNEAGVEEFFNDEANEELKENRIISNFLRSLGDKNYHQANIHLKEIIENKVKKKLVNSIK